MRTLRSIFCIIYFLVYTSVISHSADNTGFVFSKWPIKASKQMPDAGTPEARAIEFLRIIRTSGFDAGKEYVASDISAADRAAWKQYQGESKKGDTLYSWHVYKVVDGLPIVSLNYKNGSGQTYTRAFKMVKEDGKWMVAGY